MKAIQVAVACHSASGVPQIPVLAVLASQNEIDTGRYYEQAINLAQDLGYHGPMICFDADEPSAILAAAKALNLVPQVVAVDFTDGQVNSIRCDAGEIRVICYDESDTDEYSAAVVDIRSVKMAIPLGAGRMSRSLTSIRVSRGPRLTISGFGERQSYDRRRPLRGPLP